MLDSSSLIARSCSAVSGASSALTFNSLPATPSCSEETARCLGSYDDVTSS
jgi:hypothetical protein